MVEQVIYCKCSKVKRQLCENGQDSAASWEIVSWGVICHHCDLQHGNTRVQ